MTLRALIEAVRANDVAQVQSILRARSELIDMETAENDERRPIHYAVLNRLPEVVRVLMQNGANARVGIYPHRAATTALTIARERGYLEIEAIILEEERKPPAEEEQEVVLPPEKQAVASGDLAWLRARHAGGRLANRVFWGSGGLLTCAVEHGRADVLNLLLELGFDPNERVRSPEMEEEVYSQGFPLWQCAALGEQEMAEMLLKRGADPNAHVYASGSSVYSAYSHRQEKMVELLLRHGGIVTADIAAVYRLTDTARQLLANASDPLAIAQELLEHGASGGAPEIVAMALDYIDWPNDDSRWFHILASPLSFWNHIPWLYAGDRELDRGTYIQCFEKILPRCGANRIGRFSRTMLHEVAALRDYVTEEEGLPFAAALIAAGARLDVRDQLLMSTPLGWACRWGRIEVARLLLEHGADPIERDAQPWATPMAWAQKSARSDVVALLTEHGAGSR